MAAAELGMCSAARLFAREIAAEGGDELVAQARDQLGRHYPVLDFVAGRWIQGDREPPIDPAPALQALEGISKLLIVGIEADFLDALVPMLPSAELGLITEEGGLEADVHRVVANYGGRVQMVSLAGFQRWAGRRSALLTLVYGTNGHTANVSPVWLRVSGPDVRAQFRSLVGWDILGRPMFVYPRWLVETSCDDFSTLVGSGREADRKSDSSATPGEPLRARPSATPLPR
jgi:hypothetical protein